MWTIAQECKYEDIRNGRDYKHPKVKMKRGELHTSQHGLMKEYGVAIKRVSCNFFYWLIQSYVWDTYVCSKTDWKNRTGPFLLEHYSSEVGSKTSQQVNRIM